MVNFTTVEAYPGAPGPAGAVADFLAAGNAWVAPRRLRSYQLGVWESGSLVMPDPRGGPSLRAAGTIYGGLKRFAWRFQSPRGPAWLFTSNTAQAYQLQAVLDGGELFLFHEAENRDALLRWAAEVAARPDEGAAEGPARLLLGHLNFAHFFWNEMPAALELENRRPAVDAVAVNAAPILPVERLLPGLGAPVVQTTEHELGKNRFRPGVLFAAGSTWVTAATRARVVEACRAHAAPMLPPALDALLAGRFPVWISLRLMYRHAVNQPEAMAAVIRGLAAHPGRFAVMLDGYSLPHDLEHPGRYDVPRQREHNAAVCATARALVEGLGPAVTAAAPVIDTTGCELPVAIALAGRARFYVANHGTQQHKIGWLYPVPGVNHANLYVTRMRPEGWTANQAEGAAKPVYVPAELIAPPGRADERADPYYGDYSFTDPEAVARFIVDQVLRAAAG